MMDTPSIPPPFVLAEALVTLRDHAHEVAERLERLWLTARHTDDMIEADALDPLVGEAAVLAAHADALQHRVTGQAMTTTIGRQLEHAKRARGEWPSQ